MARDIPVAIEIYALKIIHANKEIADLLMLLSDKEKIRGYYKRHPQDVDDAIQLLTKASKDIQNGVGKLMGFGR